jgi:hypothetical protein
MLGFFPFDVIAWDELAQLATLWLFFADAFQRAPQLGKRIVTTSFYINLFVQRCNN